MNIVRYISKGFVPFLVYVVAAIVLLVNNFFDPKVIDIFVATIANATSTQILSVKEVRKMPPKTARAAIRDKAGIVEILKADNGKNIFNLLRIRAPRETVVFLDKVALDNVDLRGINLSGAKLHWSKIREANFSKARLLGAYLFHCHCHHSDFSEANLGPLDNQRTVLDYSFLNGANFSGANMPQVDLIQASLVEAVFDGAEIGLIDARSSKWPYASLRGVTSKAGPVDLQGSIGAHADLSNAELPGVNFRDSILTNANLTGANFSNGVMQNAEMRGVTVHETNFTGANMHNVILYYTDLRTAKMQGADLTDAGLLGVNASGVDFRGATLNLINADFANFSGANLKGVSLHDAALIGADLTGANLEDADLSAANLQGAKLVNAKLRGARFAGADLRAADFGDTDLAGVNFEGAKLDGAKFDGPAPSLEPNAAKTVSAKGTAGGSIVVLTGAGEDASAAKAAPNGRKKLTGTIESRKRGAIIGLEPIRPEAYMLREIMGDLIAIVELALSGPEEVGSKIPASNGGG